LAHPQVFFEPHREESWRAIGRGKGCNVFIDDLPEVLLHPDFPRACERFLFSSSPHEGLKNFFILANFGMTISSSRRLTFQSWMIIRLAADRLAPAPVESVD